MSEVERNHIVKDYDYCNIIGMLNILSRQLELSLEESKVDYAKITDFFLHSASGGAVNSKLLNESITALQYFDKKTQRIEHVIDSLNMLASNIGGECWSSLDLDLEDEVDKTHSFFNRVQTDELYLMVESSIGNGLKVRPPDTNDESDDSIELF